MSYQLKTEVIVIRLTKEELSILEAKKTRPLIGDWLKELAFSAPDRQEKTSE
ncbi:MbeCy [Budviciaceae bacterium BWR-B9]|uniref:MbeCy n=2 Tax=Limnobaculum TaxID=2172100 RepID=A0A9D7AGC1_9GAMM|nr:MULTISPECIES: MbeCy [Limnobaculum]MBK5072213.1 MbeCy [Limnobaculum xujianqingii]MBK5143598.1 MbeCy [Limnobaculum allomyrinae]MBK5175522.1 MbeCy [Limnobaculum xujianqingii]MBV7691488.1 MbeCy [Limnobaculum sp. M2-1]